MSIPVLDPGFRPPVLAHRRFASEVAESGGVPLVLAVERDAGRISRYETRVYAADHPSAATNLHYAERLLKFLLWQWGGWKIYVGGPSHVARHLQECYSPTGERAFDADLWGNQVYRKGFSVVHTTPEEAPAATEDAGSEVDLDWKGWRIGFDLGASDRKVAAVKDGKLALQSDGTPVLSEELEWDPKPQPDPKWHAEKIMGMLRHAESMIREADGEATVRAIGGSSAGIYVNGITRIASLFRGVTSRETFEREVAPIFQNIAKEWGVPFRLENDGDVTALAGAISLDDGAVLGLAMGSSLAAGYVDDRRCIRGWMNELAFAPVDYQPEAPIDEWSHDRGVGANYFSQQAVGRLIPCAGIDMPGIPEGALPERLKKVQDLMAAGDERALRIYETIGSYFGYTVAHFSHFYHPVRHIEVLGRVMTGAGGQTILAQARRILRAEFPETADSINFYEPDEREKRHGQAAAAASLPRVV